MKALLLLLPAAAALLVLLAQPGSAQADIGTTAGPVHHAWIGRDLRCQAEHGADAFHEFYPDDATQGDCATWIAVGDIGGTLTLYGPDFSVPTPATTIGASASGGPIGTYTPVTQLSQSPVTGAGTASSPMTVTTVVQAAEIKVTQKDTYVTGEDLYRTTVKIENTGTATRLVVVYRAGNCMTPVGDFPGYGWLDVGLGQAGCADNADDTPNAGISGFVAVPTAGSPSAKIADGFYGNIWSVLRVRGDFNDMCVCTSSGNHGGGIDWRIAVGPGSSRSFDSETIFKRAPSGPPNIPPTVAPTADPSRVTCATPEVTFGSGARDPDGTIVLAHWTFGDGTESYDLEARHAYAASGTYTATLSVTDDRGGTASGTVTFTTNGDTNCCPETRPISDRVTVEGRTVRLPIRATDGDVGDTLAYSVDLADGTPAPGWTVNAATGSFSWSTRPGDAGTYAVVAHATDGACDSAATFSITVDASDASNADDEDRDGVSTRQDNCPSVPNRLQEDTDTDGTGDACDVGSPPGADDPPAPTDARVDPFDLDGDGVADGADRCPLVPDPSQGDLDGDGDGDACDPDRDGDGVREAGTEWADDCPFVADPAQVDADRDGIGDACDPDVAVAQRPEASLTPRAAPTPAPGALLGLAALGCAAVLAARQRAQRQR